MIYVLVTLGAQMLLPDARISEAKEVAFALVGQEAFGTFGLWFASLGAVLSTASAVNATLFSTARLMETVAEAGEFPRRLAGERHGVPATAVVVLAGAGGAIALLPGITELVSFGSLSFLGVFAVVNVIHATRADGSLDAAIGWVGAVACTAAAVALVGDLAAHDRLGLALVGGALVLLVVARLGFRRHERQVAA